MFRALSLVIGLEKFQLNGRLCRKDEQKVKELFDAIDMIQADFESIERPLLEVESPTRLKTPRRSERHPNGFAISRGVAEVPGKDEATKKPSIKQEGNPQMDAELTKLMMELGETDSECSPKEIGEWEFDELEKDFPPMAVTAAGTKTESPSSKREIEEEA